MTHISFQGFNPPRQGGMPPPLMNVSVGQSGRLVIGGHQGSQAPSQHGFNQPPPTTVNLPPPGIANLQPSGPMQMQQNNNTGFPGMQSLQQPGAPQPVAPPSSAPQQFQSSIQQRLTALSNPGPVAAPGTSGSGFSNMSASVPPVTVLTSVPAPIQPPWNSASSSQTMTSTSQGSTMGRSGRNVLSHLVRTPTLCFLNRSDTNRAVQAQKVTRSLKFQYKKKKDYTICVAKIKVLISFAVTA